MHVAPAHPRLGVPAKYHGSAQKTASQKLSSVWSFACWARYYQQPGVAAKHHVSAQKSASQKLLNVLILHADPDVTSSKILMRICWSAS